MADVHQIRFDILSATVVQDIVVVDPAYDEDSIIEGLNSGDLVTTTWHNGDETMVTIDTLADGKKVAKIVAQEIEGEYEDFR